jgi:hypothetical protein
MVLGLNARRYISVAVEEFGSVKQRCNWVEWDHRSIDGDAPPSICAIAIKVLSLKANILDERIEATSEKEENAFSDVIADLRFLQSLIRDLEGVPA